MATHSSILAWKTPVGRGAWQVTVPGVPESDTTQRLKDDCGYREFVLKGKVFLHANCILGWFSMLLELPVS